MSSFSSQFNPRANIFLIVNLGCEMLYVIDQRLKAQQIDKAKAAQVYLEITGVLLDPKFIDSLIKGSIHEHSELLTREHCCSMLNDIATSSLMRLDDSSMDKLWNLMTMVYKWQLFVSKHPHHLLDNTFRHLDSVAKLYPDANISLLGECAKSRLLDFWNSFDDYTQLSVYRTNKAWLRCFNTKISLLIRLGFQAINSSFIEQVDESYFADFVDSAGDNVYIKSFEIATNIREDFSNSSGGFGAARNSVDQLQADILGIKTAQLTQDENNEVQNVQQKLQQCTTLFEELDVKNKCEKDKSVYPESLLDMSLFQYETLAAKCQKLQEQAGEFVPVTTVYNRNSETTSESSAGNNASGSSAVAGLNKELLDVYSKMN